MYKIIGTNWAWVSTEGFFRFCKVISTLENWDSFKKIELEKKFSTDTAYHKVRSNLEYATSLGIITRINEHYKIEDTVFFQLLKEGKQEEAKKHLKDRIEQHSFFQKILTEFFYNKRTKTLKELREFMRLIDEDYHKARHYHNGGKFFAKFLDETKLVEYNQRVHTITLRNGKMSSQKDLLEMPPKIITIPKPNLFEDIKNIIITNVKSIDDKKELAKYINAMSESDRTKITEKLLENIK